MSREEEQKRFVEWYLDKSRLPEAPTYETDCDGLFICLRLNTFFDIWLAAKHDAKPVVEIHQSKYHGYRDVHRVIHNGDVLYQSTSSELASAWIEANGYRLE